jgi:hypothetical protein
MDIEKAIDGVLKTEARRPVSRRPKARDAGADLQSKLNAAWEAVRDEGGTAEFEEACDKLFPQGYGHAGADWKDIDGLAESFKEALKPLGILVLEDPIADGSDQYSYILVKA